MSFRTRTLGAFALALSAGGTTHLEAQSWKTVAQARQVTDEDQIDVRLTYGVGVLTLESGDAETLYRTRLTFDEERATPVMEYGNGSLHVGISRYEGGPIDLMNWSSGGSLDVELSPRIPMSLELELGAVKANLDFTGLPLRGLALSTGASESTLHIDEPNSEQMERATFQVGAADFRLSGIGNLNAEEVSIRAGVGSVTLELDGEWAGNQALSIDMGLGALEIRIPEGLGVRLEQSSFLTSIDTGGMVRRDGAYYSSNWEGADHRVEVEVSAAFGTVNIVWTR